MWNKFSEYRKIIEKSAEVERCVESKYKEFENIILKNIKGICLEIGCGDGIWIQKLKKKSNFLVSLDLSKERVKIAKKKNPYVKFVICDARNLPFKENIFDAIVALEIIEHLPNYGDHKKFLSEVKRVLTSSGKFLISTPNRPIYRIYKKLIKDSDFTHFSELSYYQFRKILKNTFSQVKIYGKFGWLSPFYKLFFIKIIHRFLSKFVPLCKGLLAICRK